MEELKVIQERFLKVNYNMKVHIIDQLYTIAYPEITDTKSPVEPVKTKGDP